MSKIFRCECGCSGFQYFGLFSRCMKCQNDYKRTSYSDTDQPEFWVRRFNLEEKKYSPNWEKALNTENLE